MTIDADKLRALEAAATAGPWAYRPGEFDDWGTVKAPPHRPEGWEYDLSFTLAQFRDPGAVDDEILAQHREAKTGPWRGNAELTVYLRNAVPTILTQADRIAVLEAALREAQEALQDTVRSSVRNEVQADALNKCVKALGNARQALGSDT